MPRGNGLGLATGVAQGADAFVRSFMQARQLKNQEKLQKNMIVVDLLMSQLHDERTSYYQRAKILDQIPQLIGAKTERPLSSILGYDKLNEEDFVTEQGIPSAESKQGTSDRTVVDENVSDPSMASSVNIRGTEATSAIEGTPDKTVKYGNLSPADIKLQQTLQAQRLANANDVEKQATILRINYELQSKVLGKNGYSKEIFRGYDKDGNYVITLANSQGEKKDINLGPVTSEAIKKAQVMGGNKSLGRFGQLMMAQQTVAAYEADPTSVPEPNYLAAKQTLEDFEKTGHLKDAQITALTQGATGSKPLSPAQITNNQQEDERTRLNLQAALDNFDSELASVEEAVTYAEADVNDFYNIQIQPIKDRMKEWLDEGGEKDDKEYTDLQNQLRILNSQHASLKARLNATKAKKTTLEKKRAAAEKRLSGFTPSTGAATAQSNSSVDDEINQYRNYIDAFKTDNISNPKAKGLTDRQILKILKDAKRIP